MNDTELDQLLNTWEAPSPPQSLRDRLRARFPRAERTRFPRPLRWGLVTLFASAALTFAVAQTGERHGDALMRAVHMHIRGLMMMVDAHRASFLVQEVRNAQPKVYVDGQPAPPLEYGHASSLRVQIPGDGTYSVIFFDVDSVHAAADGSPSPWVKAGRVHDNLIEFEAGGRQVRIEFNGPLPTGGLPVYVRRQPGR